MQLSKWNDLPLWLPSFQRFCTLYISNTPNSSLWRMGVRCSCHLFSGEQILQNAISGLIPSSSTNHPRTRQCQQSSFQPSGLYNDMSLSALPSATESHQEFYLKSQFLVLPSEPVGRIHKGCECKLGCFLLLRSRIPLPQKPIFGKQP